MAQKLQEEKEERQIMDEFDKVQKQLIEDLKQQLDIKYSQEMEKLYRNEQMQINEEILCTAELITRVLRKESQEVPIPREPLTCLKCSEKGHKEKGLCETTILCKLWLRRTHGK